jgi:hypothetical protein
MDGNRDWMKFVEYCVGGLSISGCIFILLIFFCYRKLRNFSFECVAYLTFSSMLTTISYMINYIDQEDHYIEPTFKCKAQAFMMVLFENSQYIWAMLIAYYIHQAVIFFEENHTHSHKYTRINFLLVGYLIPLGMAVIAMFRDVYGPSGRWCWIDTKENLTENKVFSLVFYFIFWLMIFLNFYFNLKVMKYLNRQIDTEREREVLSRYYKKMMIYPFIQIICIIPGTINRFLQIFLNRDIYVLQMIQILFTMMQGFLYAVVYGYTNQVRKALYGTFENVCRCCFGKKRSDSVSSMNSQKLYERTYSNFSSDGSFEHPYSTRQDISAP